MSSYFKSPYQKGSEVRRKFYDSLHNEWPDFLDHNLKKIVLSLLVENYSFITLKDFNDRDRLDLIMFQILDSNTLKNYRIKWKQSMNIPLNLPKDFLLDKIKLIIGEYLFEKNMAGEV